MDDDGSGLISFMEFAGMVREELLLGPKELPEKELKAVWLALDSDGSGQLKVGEFGAFMNLGARAQCSSLASPVRPKFAQSPGRHQSFQDNRKLSDIALLREIAHRKQGYEAQSSKLEKELASLWRRSGASPGTGCSHRLRGGFHRKLGRACETADGLVGTGDGGSGGLPFIPDRPAPRPLALLCEGGIRDPPPPPPLA